MSKKIENELLPDEEWVAGEVCPLCGGRIISAHDGVMVFCEHSWKRYTLDPTDEARQKMCGYGLLSG